MRRDAALFIKGCIRGFPICFVLAYAWLFLMPSCAGTRYQRSVESVKASYITYTTLAPTVAQEIADMVHRPHPLADDEKIRLRRLDALGKDLEIYRNLHNLYIDALVLTKQGADFGGKLGDRYDPPPSETFAKMKKLLDQIIKDALSLHLSFQAVRL